MTLQDAIAAVTKELNTLPVDKAKELAHVFHQIVSHRLYVEAAKKLGPKQNNG